MCAFDLTNKLMKLTITSTLHDPGFNPAKFCHNDENNLSHFEGGYIAGFEWFNKSSKMVTCFAPLSMFKIMDILCAS